MSYKRKRHYLSVMNIQTHDNVRFVADSRNGDWKKGQQGYVFRVLALPPQNQSQLFIVRFRPDGHSAFAQDIEVWATERDVEVTRQMTIFDVLPTNDASSD